MQLACLTCTAHSFPKVSAMHCLTKHHTSSIQCTCEWIYIYRPVDIYTRLLDFKYSLEYWLLMGILFFIGYYPTQTAFRIAIDRYKQFQTKIVLLLKSFDTKLLHICTMNSELVALLLSTVCYFFCLNKLHNPIT